jgi:hypothetical protein
MAAELTVREFDQEMQSPTKITRSLGEIIKTLGQKREVEVEVEAEEEH